MKYIITETQLRLLEMELSVKRRIGAAEDYINALDPKDVCDYWTESEVDEYVSGVLSDAIVNSRLPDYRLYDEVYEYLLDKYEDYVRDFFYNSLCE